MTHSGPVENDGVRGIVGSLCLALTRLDSSAVDLYRTDLEVQISLLRGGVKSVSADEAEMLSGDLKFARALVENANRLYAGWVRAAALRGATYNSSGTEPAATMASSVIVQG